MAGESRPVTLAIEADGSWQMEMALGWGQTLSLGSGDIPAGADSGLVLAADAFSLENEQFGADGDGVFRLAGTLAGPDAIEGTLYLETGPAGAEKARIQLRFALTR